MPKARSMQPPKKFPFSLLQSFRQQFFIAPDALCLCEHGIRMIRTEIQKARERDREFNFKIPVFLIQRSCLFIYLVIYTNVCRFFSVARIFIWFSHSRFCSRSINRKRSRFVGRFSSCDLWGQYCGCLRLSVCTVPTFNFILFVRHVS